MYSLLGIIKSKNEIIYYEFVMDKILKIFKKEFYSDYHNMYFLFSN